MNEFTDPTDLAEELHLDSSSERLKKAPHAYRTISEVADELHVPQHVLRFWETRFPEVKPLKRGGGRRYYRPEDIHVLRRISDLLYVQGYTIKGVQRVLREGDAVSRPVEVAAPVSSAATDEEIFDSHPQPIEIPAPPSEATESTSEVPAENILEPQPDVEPEATPEPEALVSEKVEDAAPQLNVSTSNEEAEFIRVLKDDLEQLRRDKKALRGELRNVLEELDGIRRLLPIS
ncbi:MerR family transcriptional regulator [Kozakia baliensis NRIC 0488]|uniref:Uncharacterized protein n=1 Tax=Kozakia baliensis TaxID=153496 RepID=A0A1D8UTX2_9PROT|nr:hypothetical protein A0U89_08040 [Kozakia baliensis]GBR24840.1 MerR family transcriptional regulator [Kozakia baliensis NRIC 0488]GEL63826.1 MerR family transcriptional regulator [Kozakia baliensis]